MPRRLRLTLLIGVFLIIYASFGVISWREQSQWERIREQIRVAQRVIATQTAQGYEELTAKYQEVQRSFPTNLETADVISAIIGLAEASGFNTELGSSDIDSIKREGSATTETVGKGKYQVLPFSMEITGDHERVLHFIARLGSGQALETLVLRKVDVAQSKRGTKATIEFVIYTQAQPKAEAQPKAKGQPK